MNKSQIYKKVQDLFPSSLGEGDVACDADNAKEMYEVLRVFPRTIVVWCTELVGTLYFELQDLKLIRKRITRDMVLEAWYEKDGRPTGAGWSEFIYTHQKDIIPLIAQWIPTKDNKDLSLYDQSIDLIKLVYEVLK